MNEPAAGPSRRSVQDASGKSVVCVDIPQLDYGDAWRLQVGLVAARRTPALDADVLLLLEHPSVFTLGRRGGRENLTVPEAFLEKSGIPIFHVERGGDITYHGPGQIVGYPVLHLQAAGLSVTEYVGRLEEVMIRTAARWGVACERNSLNRGIWVGNSKMGSVGVAVRRGVTFHGFAFNVNLDLEPFCWINPCGLKGIGMTSLQKEVGAPLPMDEVRAAVKQSFESVFGVRLMPADLASIAHFGEDAAEPQSRAGT